VQAEEAGDERLGVLLHVPARVAKGRARGVGAAGAAGVGQGPRQSNAASAGAPAAARPLSGPSTQHSSGAGQPPDRAQPCPSSRSRCRRPKLAAKPAAAAAHPRLPAASQPSRRQNHT
jgi:hypothetical protein